MWTSLGIDVIIANTLCSLSARHLKLFSVLIYVILNVGSGYYCYTCFIDRKQKHPKVMHVVRHTPSDD